MRRGDWERHQQMCDAVVTVYESSIRPLSSALLGPASGAVDSDQLCLRAAVYYAKLGAYAEIHITSFIDLRQVNPSSVRVMVRRSVCIAEGVHTTPAARLISCAPRRSSARCIKL